MSTRRLAALAASSAALAIMLGGCGSETPEQPQSSTPASASPTGSAPAAAEPSDAAESSEAPAPATLDITVKGDRVRPNSEQLELGRGEKLRLRVRTDRAIELHVHASPEKFLEFDAGRSTAGLSFARAGVVEIEEHESGQVLAKVIVR